MKIRFTNKKYILPLLVLCLVPFGYLILVPWLARLKKQTKDEIIEKYPSMGSNQTRGFRNNNPLNMRVSNNAWKNKIPLSKNSDGQFEQFTSMEWGLRAALINIRTHFNRGKNTIRKLVETWAPSNENDTENYIKFVSDQSGVPENTPLKFEKGQLFGVVKAMVKIESAFTITNELFDKAWKLI